jgi:hypothetical protein
MASRPVQVRTAASNAAVIFAAVHAGHGNPLRLALALVAGLVLYGLMVLVSRTRLCPKCYGERVIRRGRRAVPCPRCQARGRVLRPGARLVHRLFWVAAGERLMERRKAAHRGPQIGQALADFETPRDRTEGQP